MLTTQTSIKTHALTLVASFDVWLSNSSVFKLLSALTNVCTGFEKPHHLDRVCLMEIVALVKECKLYVIARRIDDGKYIYPVGKTYADLNTASVTVKLAL